MRESVFFKLLFLSKKMGVTLFSLTQCSLLLLWCRKLDCPLIIIAIPKKKQYWDTQLVCQSLHQSKYTKNAFSNYTICLNVTFTCLKISYFLSFIGIHWITRNIRSHTFVRPVLFIDNSLVVRKKSTNITNLNFTLFN